jgi:hypothetical protein
MDTTIYRYMDSEVIREGHASTPSMGEAVAVGQLTS